VLASSVKIGDHCHYVCDLSFFTMVGCANLPCRLRGRHRGLPVALDRAVLLPNELVTNPETFGCGFIGIWVFVVASAEVLMANACATKKWIMPNSRYEDLSLGLIR
jgi:hypothetical protein